MSVQVQTARNTVRTIQALRDRREPVTVLTAYDVVVASILDECGLDIVLVGDSLGNVVLGYDTTIPVTLDDMIRHAGAVVRGCSRPLVICDLPFGSTVDEQTALAASVRVLREAGCQGVKLEGGAIRAATVRRIVDEGIPVMGHIGLTPQSVHRMGGYYMHGKDEAGAEALMESALALQEAGAFSIVLECVAPATANAITEALTIPTIGIGAGPDCAGQVLVTNDLLGWGVRPPPKFAKPLADLASVARTAVTEYVRRTKEGVAKE